MGSGLGPKMTFQFVEVLKVIVEFTITTSKETPFIVFLLIKL
ncbi:MAG: hypothetical protein ACI9AV_000446 [Sediminicola sp.]|jgi:hypothetical protein